MISFEAIDLRLAVHDSAKDSIRFDVFPQSSIVLRVYFKRHFIYVYCKGPILILHVDVSLHLVDEGFDQGCNLI